MRYRYLVFLGFMAVSLAEPQTRCPSVAEIKRGEFATWLPLTVIGEELASAAAIEQFKAHVQSWQSAAWNVQYLEYAHCFYAGDDPIVTQIVFAHDAWHPASSAAWVWQIAKRQAVCEESLDTCHYLF